MTPTELKDHRERLGMTQAALAAYIGVHPNTVAKWERGEQGIRHAAAIRALLLALGESETDTQSLHYSP